MTEYSKLVKKLVVEEEKRKSRIGSRLSMGSGSGDGKNDIKVEREGKVVYICLNRPKEKNAINPQVHVDRLFFIVTVW